MSEHEPQREALAEGTLMSHLLELRDRLIRSVIAVVVMFLPCAALHDHLFTWIAQPLINQLPDGTSMIATNVVAPVLTPLKLAFFSAVFLAMPYVLYQAWAFVAPGLYRHEKRFAIPLLLSSIVLFYAGAAFAYFVVSPLIFAFLSGTVPIGVTFSPDMTQYLDFILFLYFAFGVGFEIPVATVLLAATGLVRVETMVNNRAYVLLGIFVVAAILTPPDVISQSLLAIPMYLLYEVGIVMSRVLLKEKLAQRAAEEQAEEQNAN